MRCLRETTLWHGLDSARLNHTYLLNGDQAVAYVVSGTDVPYYFAKPMRLDRRNRSFVSAQWTWPTSGTTDPEHWSKLALTKQCVSHTLSNSERNVHGSSKSSINNRKQGVLSMSNKVTNDAEETKVYTVVGTSTFNGQSKVRFTNDVGVRIKTLVKGGHTNVELIELPQPMTKLEAVQWLLDNRQSNLDYAAIEFKAEDLGLITAPTTKSAKAVSVGNRRAPKVRKNTDPAVAALINAASGRAADEAAA